MDSNNDRLTALLQRIDAPDLQGAPDYSNEQGATIIGGFAGEQAKTTARHFAEICRLQDRIKALETVSAQPVFLTPRRYFVLTTIAAALGALVPTVAAITIIILVSASR